MACGVALLAAFVANVVGWRGDVEATFTSAMPHSGIRADQLPGLSPLPTLAESEDQHASHWRTAAGTEDRRRRSWPEGCAHTKVEAHHFVTEPLPPDLEGTRRDNVSQKYSHSIVVGNSLYAMPDAAQEVLKIEMRRSRMSFLKPSLGRKAEKYGQAVAVGGLIYVVPKRQDRILKIDTADDSLEMINATLEPRGAKWDVALAVGHHVYGIPQDARRVLKIDTRNDSVSLIGPLLSSVENKYISGAAVGHLIYCAPLEADKVLKVDAIEDTVSELIIPFTPKDKLVLFRWASTVSFGSDVYGIPYNAHLVMKIDSLTDNVTMIGEALGNKNGKWLGAAVIGGHIYAMPHHHEHVLKINTTDAKVTRLSHYKPPSGPSRWAGAAVVGGVFYGAAYHAEQVLSFDPRSEVMNVIGDEVTIDERLVEEGDYSYKSCVSSQGTLWCPPGSATKVLKIDVMFSDPAQGAGAKLVERDECQPFILESTLAGAAAGVLVALASFAQGLFLKSDSNRECTSAERERRNTT